jgi:WD40 repeat protein
MSKKNRNIIIAIMCVVILLSAFYTSSKSPLVRQLSGPIEGTDSVLTIGDKLFVISKNNQVFTWQWNDLKIWPVAAKPSAAVITPYANDKIIYNPSNNSAKLILTNLKADTELGGLSLPYGAECKAIKTSQNGKFGIVSVSFKEGTQKGLLKLGVFNENSKDPSFVFQKDTNAENFAIYDFAITNNGNLLAGAGEKGNAWVFVSNVNSQSILWEKTFDEHSKFTCAEFSPDGKLLFIAEKVRHILIFDAATGELVKEFVMDEYQTPSNQKQNISCIDISPDRKILAVDTEPARTVWFWDIASGNKIGKIYASDLTVSGIAFSPDSKFLATGCLVTPEIKIWKVPQLKNVK